MPEAESSAQPVAAFEAQIAELEKIVKELEGGELPLERSLALFERAVELANACRKQLEEAETKVEILVTRNHKVRAEPFKTAQE